MTPLLFRPFFLFLSFHLLRICTFLLVIHNLRGIFIRHALVPFRALIRLIFTLSILSPLTPFTLLTLITHLPLSIPFILLQPVEILDLLHLYQLRQSNRIPLRTPPLLHYLHRPQMLLQLSHLLLQLLHLQYQLLVHLPKLYVLVPQFLYLPLILLNRCLSINLQFLQYLLQLLSLILFVIEVPMK